MTIAGLRRKWSRLISQVEREEGKKFLRKPTLTLYNGRPSNISERYRKGKRVTEVTKAKVLMNRRMARDSEKLAVLCAKHELREQLALQHGKSKTESHKLACAREKRDRRKLGFRRSSGWLLREFFGG